MNAQQYYHDARAPRYAILLAAPLLVAYETLAWSLGTGPAGVRNGADVLLKEPFARLGGMRGIVVFEVLLVLIGAALVVRDWRRHPGPLRWTMFPLMLLEAAGLAVLVGLVLRYATAELLHFFALSNPAHLGRGAQLIISLGAGIYEELLFRVVLVGVLSWLAARVFHWPSRGAYLFAIVGSAIVFSAFHYIGAFGDTLQLSSFVFRMLAGLVFSTLYVFRGFGITAWTHALYDVLVTLNGG
jgi:membrane protease YdiL (CAAX protease family)